MSGIIHDMTQIARCGAQFRADHLEELGLKGCHASYLMEICADPGLSQDTLAQRICINKSNIARQVAVLEEGGFVRRCTSPTDKRVAQLYPTEKTMEIMPQIEGILRDWSGYVTQDLTAQELQLLTGLVQTMACRAAAWMEERG